MLFAFAPALTDAQTGDRFFPANAVINVKTQYGAKGDGATDDTAALQRAVRENVGTNAVLYFPAGTYIIGDRLEWRNPADTNRPWKCALTLMGQNRATTVIRLRDNAAGYGDANNPKAVIYTASNDFTSQGGPRPGYMEYGVGNEAFANYVENLTVDTGNNAGAIGIDYLASNYGAVRDVTIKGAGVAGLNLSRSWQGPELIKNVRVEGFGYGVLIGEAQYAVTFEFLTLINQRTAGLKNHGNAISVRRLTSINTVPAVQNTDSLGLVTIIDADLTGGAANASAIENNGQMLARNIKAFGYQSAIKHNGAVVAGTLQSEWVSRAPFTLFPDASQNTLNLPVEETPAYHDNNLNNWAYAEDYGAHASDPWWNDDSDGLQAALNSGKSTIYLKRGVYFVSRTLVVPPSVRRIIGFHADFSPNWGTFTDAANPKPMFVFKGGRAGFPLLIERIGISRQHSGSNSPQHRGLLIFQQSERRLVLRDISTLTAEIYGTYRSTPRAGRLYLENICAAQFYFNHFQQVWARQFNPEGNQLRVVNNGASLWILGIKTEGFGSIIDTGAGGSTELLGGNLYSTTPPANPLPPAFINRGGRVSLSYATTAFGPWSADFPVHVRETRGAETRQMLFDDLVWRGYGRIVPLFVSSQTNSAGTD